MGFSEHGQFLLKSSGSIIYYRVIGSWNVESSKTCVLEINRCFQQLGDNQPFIMIVDTTEFDGGLDEAYSIWKDILPSWISNGLTHFIRIDNCKSVKYQLFVERMDKVLQTLFHFDYADNLEEAISKAKTYGFKGVVCH